MSSLSRPSHRDEFDTAIICALRLEFNAVTLLFDEYWDQDGHSYGKVPGDRNTYIVGRMEQRNVVLVLLSGIGKVNAATAAANIITSYNRVKLALIVGICGGLPKDNDGKDNFLGDIIISESAMQYDLGRVYPDRRERKDGFLDNLGKPSGENITFVKTLQTDIYLERLLKRTQKNLDILQDQSGPPGVNVDGTGNPGKYEYPGVAEDKLFEPIYYHKHHEGCSTCCQGISACQTSQELSCNELHCDEARLERQRSFDIGDTWRPVVHFGTIASGDSVIKSAEDRDKIARETKAIAFEMEGAGIWDTLPCIVVKGVCDYADTHKNKKWQNFAAATAACAAKALLGLATPPDRASPQIASRSNVPLIKGNIAKGGARQMNRIRGAHGEISNNSAIGGGRQENSIDLGSCRRCVIL
ncbi:phosphorylase superfamily protein [Drechslerella dactyloides]|uniref:Phosphorylase superfamily protein n=1 Tax=Drechslerella dactyloides TaxID=74499 RepID=A0AAD6J1V8_DREDA|nr:phosphorylase superfamily protein [Drechslerella dactyloides]